MYICSEEDILVYSKHVNISFSNYKKVKILKNSESILMEEEKNYLIYEGAKIVILSGLSS
jgi:hypothetical protein